jgi:hypothetical protein
MAIPNATANVRNLADLANEEAAAFVLGDDVDGDGVAIVVFMIRTPGHC